MPSSGMSLTGAAPYVGSTRRRTLESLGRVPYGQRMEIAASRADHRSLRRELEAGVRGDVLTDRVSRGLYATDASIYQQEPLAVVLPRDEADVSCVLDIALRRGLSVLPRGGGTSLAGQGTTRGVVLDFSKYMTRLIELDAAEQTAWVEPGLVRDELNAQLAPHGLHFAPETSTSNRANIGGMIGNNSSGTRSIRYGKTVDHVLELKVELITGERLHLRSMSPDRWRAVAASKGKEGYIYRRVAQLIDRHREEIARRYPKVMRRVGGYNLDLFPPGGDWNLSKLIVGSEGTLATVLAAKLQLEPLPRAEGLCVVHFHELQQALRAVAPIVALDPSAVELVDRNVIELARDKIAGRHRLWWLHGSPAAVLIVGVYGEDERDVEAQLSAVRDELQRLGLGYACSLVDERPAQAEVWALRKAGLGLLLSMRGDPKPTAFIEDAAVPVERLPDYIADVQQVCREVEVDVAFYAHASVGLLHVRPVLDLKQPGDVDKMKRISEATFELVRTYGGSWSGEHGDGRARSYQNRRFFGDELYEAFVTLKRIFDPPGLMNPGNIVDAPPMDRDLRLGGGYRAVVGRTRFGYRDAGGFDRAVELCTGVGACRKTASGTMCPSYIATRDEAHSTRGRANALRLAMSGQLGPGGMTSHSLHEVLDLCLGCKACKAECPSSVDVARLKSEFLAGYHDRHGARPGELFFALAPQVAAVVAGPLAPLINRVVARPAARELMEKLLGIDRRRPLPPFSRESLQRWFARERPEQHLPAARPLGEVALFDDTFASYHEPAIGRAAVRLLQRLGYRVELARAGCCCRPMLSLGFLDQARVTGEQTLRNLDRFAARGVPIVTLEPSCSTSLTDDLVDLVSDRPLAERVAACTVPLERFLCQQLESGVLDRSLLGQALAPLGGRRTVLHGHCQQKALYTTEATRTLLQLTGAAVSEVDGGCCGMAGAFGYERSHYELSLAIGEDRLFPALRAAGPDDILVACGFSCRHQIADALQLRARHVIEVVAGSA